LNKRRGAVAWNVEPSKSSLDKTPFERFKRVTLRMMATPKSDMDAREIKYRVARKNKNRRRHR
jgi:hypothetical protein